MERGEAGLTDVTQGRDVTGPVVRLGEVTKRYDEVVAVERVSLEIQEGEFLSILGPSGAGKTTILRMIAGFTKPTEGRVYLDGGDVTDLPPFRRNVNTVFQHYALFPHLDVGGNVAFGLKEKRLERELIRRKVAEALRMVQLEGLDRRRVRQLSGGQQQRVALARALVNEPRVLLLDEPLGALDLKLRKEMQVELKKLQHDVGITFVYVTHDQEEALVMSDRVAVINRGRIEQVASSRMIYERPATPFVANFIGETNLVEGTVKDIDGLLARVTNGNINFVVRLPRPVAPGTPVTVSLRPEKIAIRPDPEGPVNVFPGTVRSDVYRGSFLHLEVELEGGQVLWVARQILSDGDYPRPGDRLILGWDPESGTLVETEPR